MEKRYGFKALYYTPKDFATYEEYAAVHGTSPTKTLACTLLLFFTVTFYDKPPWHAQCCHAAVCMHREQVVTALVHPTRVL